VIPTTPHRRTTSTPPHRRHRAAGELRTVPPLLPVQSVSQTVPRSLESPSPVMSRRAPPPAPPGAAAHCLARFLPFPSPPYKGCARPRYLSHLSSAPIHSRSATTAGSAARRRSCRPISSSAVTPSSGSPSVSSLAPSLPLEPILVLNRARELDFEFSGEPRRRAPSGTAAAGRLPAARRLHAIGAIRWAWTTQIKRGGIPLRSVHRGPVDRVRRRRSTALRQHRVSDDVSLRQPGKPQPATWRLHSSPAGRPGSFAKRTPSFRNSQPCPSTYRNPFS
jgi:hypothetical protein